MDWTPIAYAALTLTFLALILRARAIAIRKDTK